MRQTLGRQAFLDDQPAGHPILNSTNAFREGHKIWHNLLTHLRASPSLFSGPIFVFRRMTGFAFGHFTGDLVMSDGALRNGQTGRFYHAQLHLQERKDIAPKPQRLVKESRSRAKHNAARDGMSLSAIVRSGGSFSK
jgi:hypothetical protein